MGRDGLTIWWAEGGRTPVTVEEVVRMGGVKNGLQKANVRCSHGPTI